MTWFAKATDRPGLEKPKPILKQKPVHVSHDVEVLIGRLLTEHGRLQPRQGRHLMHFSASTANADGSTDYLVRTRTHTENGMERNFDSMVRIFADQRTKLIR